VRKLAIAVLTLLVLTLPVAANMVETVGDTWNDGQGQYVPGPVYPGGRDVLHDNGPFETSPGVSLLQTDLGMNTLGFGHQFASDIHIADDFEVPAGPGWLVSGFTFFAYQTNSPTSPSPITGVYFQILDGPPDDPATSVVWGDLVTNRLTSTMWSGIYRSSDGAATNRPIMADVCQVPLTLMPGYYWVEWMTDGSLTSGPWAPPITIIGQTTTGNGMQYYQAAWGPALDSGTSTQQGFPFIIEGTIPTAVEQSSWSGIKALYR
jgi:hypothetical protein